MLHPTREDVLPCGDEGCIDQALELPLVVEGQVPELDVGHGHPVLQELDVNLGWVKASDKAVEDVLLSLLGARTGVHFHLRRLWREERRRVRSGDAAGIAAMPTLAHPPGHSDPDPPGPRSPSPPAGPFALPQALTSGRPQAEQRQQSEHPERQGPPRHGRSSLHRRFPECPILARTPPFIASGTHGQSWRGAASTSSVSR